MKIRSLIAAGLSVLLLSACVNPRSFVDPGQPKLTYEALNKRSEPLKLKLTVQFQRNGDPLPRADSTLRDNTERILRGTGVVTPVENGQEGEIKVVVNNIADTGQAAAKGFGSGLTFGLVGTTVMDAYEMSVTITANGKTVTRTAIKHAIFTAIGNTSLPEGIEAVPINVAFGRVLEQMLLRALQDLQRSGDLVHHNLISPIPWYQISAL